MASSSSSPATCSVRLRPSRPTRRSWLAASRCATLAAATPSRNGICESAEVCFYWDYYTSESLSDFTVSISNYGSTQPTYYEFKTPNRAGYQECMKNNAASAWNRSSKSVRVYANDGVSCHTLAPGYKGKLASPVANRNVAHAFL